MRTPARSRGVAYIQAGRQALCVAAQTRQSKQTERTVRAMGTTNVDATDGLGDEPEKKR